MLSQNFKPKLLGFFLKPEVDLTWVLWFSSAIKQTVTNK